jgi:hypothetical protein
VKGSASKDMASEAQADPVNPTTAYELLVSIGLDGYTTAWDAITGTMVRQSEGQQLANAMLPTEEANSSSSSILDHGIAALTRGPGSSDDNSSVTSTSSSVYNNSKRKSIIRRPQNSSSRLTKIAVEKGSKQDKEGGAGSPASLFQSKVSSGQMVGEKGMSGEHIARPLLGCASWNVTVCFVSYQISTWYPRSLL